MTSISTTRDDEAESMRVGEENVNISSYPFTELYIVHGDMAMETPNTRSRRKREMDDSQEDGASITWMHDQALRKALLMATEHEHIATPTPTQKPRPISSLLSLSSPSLNRRSSSKPRKRPCRTHRSLPIPNNDSYSTSTVQGPSSAPLSFAVGKQESQNGVDLLMSEFEKYRLGTRGERREEVTQGEDRQMSKPTSSARTALRPTTMNARSRLKGTTYLELAQPSPFTKTPTSAKPPSPMKPGLAPRIGLRSHNTPTPSTQKAFRPPLLAPQGPRSSPRRTTPNPPSTKRPIRGPSTPTMRSDVSKTNTDPSSDGLGEESFDSFDGMFQDGGAEIEELLRKVDGSQ